MTFSSRTESASNARWRLHREIRQHLEQVIIHDVADRAHLLVKPAAALDAEILRHGDLHAGAMCWRFQNDSSSGFANRENTMLRTGSFAEIVMNAKDVLLVERPRAGCG